MITLRLPGDHPNNGVIHRWAKDKESLLDSHGRDISQLKKVITTILQNNPDLGKAK